MTVTIRKPKSKEDAFLSGADHKHGANGSTGSTGSIGSTGSTASFGHRPRLPMELGQRLQELAWARRTSLNALIVDILETAGKQKEFGL